MSRPGREAGRPSRFRVLPSLAGSRRQNRKIVRRSHRRVVPAGCLALPVSIGPVWADLLLQGGTSAVEVRLELPHFEDMTQTAARRICLGGEPGANTHGPMVLSENNPLARCPASDSREAAGTLTFAITCEGRNAARATARSVLAPERFQGRITMRMGGNDMTMTEVQGGRRLGPCDGAATPGL